MVQPKFNLPHCILPFVFTLFVGFLQACSDSDGEAEPSTPLPKDPSLAVYNDPGRGEWVTVPQDRLTEECGLDPDILAEIDETAPYSYAIVRYGQLCHEFYHPDDPGPNEPAHNVSATKTLAAAVVGRTVRLSADLPRPLRDTDRMDAWVDNITFNPEALVAHVLAMVASSENLGFGQRKFEYDWDGSREINRLIDVVEAVIAQDPEHFQGVSAIGEFTQHEIFDRLGMDNSFWAGETMAIGWHSDLRDMARLGLLLIHNGVWNQSRLLSEEWVYKMTHPAFEDANTGYGYLTWLAANRNYALPGIDFKFPVPLGTCQPFAVWQDYPHPISESTDCNYNGVYSCMQIHDVGAFGAAGAGGQLIVGHRGLDLVLVTRNAGVAALIHTPWELVRRALIEHDPVYLGDEEAFCAAYEAGDYAPDLITPR
jgi:hypothetical protein